MTDAQLWLYFIVTVVWPAAAVAIGTVAVALVMFAIWAWGFVCKKQ